MRDAPAAEAGATPSEEARRERALARLFASTRGGAPRDSVRMRTVLTRLELPPPPPVVHVVGTNGKGTVAARVAAGLTAAGERPLRFLSPHVERFEERIAVAGVEIRTDELLSGLQRAWSLDPPLDAAFFELTLALALRVAADRRATWAVLEAGVGAGGGGGAATAAVGNVVAVVLTHVGADHLDQLGPTLLDVARDKAEAIRPGVPVVSGVRGEAAAVARRAAAERGSPLHLLDEDGPIFALPPSLRSDRSWATPRGVARRSLRLARA
ncbi:MAG: hypothetical protein WD336_10810, partial [Trueperaceae bacterium]